MIIDGKDAVLGRMATHAAKAALSGEEVTVLNAKDLVIIGDKNAIVAKYVQRMQVGTTSKGPFYPRTVIGIVKRAIRGMLKRKSVRGMDALRRIRVYDDVPVEFNNKPKEAVHKVRTDRPVHKVTIGELSSILKNRPA